VLPCVTAARGTPEVLHNWTLEVLQCVTLNTLTVNACQKSGQYSVTA